MAKHRTAKTSAKTSAPKTAEPPAADAASASGEEVNKSRLIQDILAVSPDRGPKDIADELTSMGVPTTPKYVSTIKTNMKTKAGLPKRKIRSKKIGSRGPSASKVVPRKPRPQTTPTTTPTTTPAAAAAAPEAMPKTELNFQHLKLAKEMAKQLGGVDQARTVLQALMQLTE